MPLRPYVEKRTLRFVSKYKTKVNHVLTVNLNVRSEHYWCNETRKKKAINLQLGMVRKYLSLVG